MMQKLLEKVVPVKAGEKGFYCTAVIPAAGQSRRMGMGVNKLYLDLCGRSVLVRTLQVFEDCPLVDEVVLVVNPEDIPYCAYEVVQTMDFKKVKRIVSGGETRQESVYSGLKEVSPKSEIVVIHDGARPLVTTSILSECIKAGQDFKAVSAAVSVTDTIKTADRNGFAVSTLDRQTLWAVQTPQVFWRDVIIKAHERAREENISGLDDAALVEHMGEKVKLVRGGYDNIKITMPQDLVWARAIILERGEGE